MEHYLRKRFAKVLRTSPERVAIDRTIEEMGIDSRMVVEVVAEVARDLALPIYPKEFYDRPKIPQLAKYLVSELRQGAVAGGDANDAGGPEASGHLRAVLWDNSRSRPARASTLGTRLPGIVFVLSSPRSGSTLLRVMLAGHSRLFAPPELHLLQFASMGERSKGLDGSYLEEGLQLAIMELMGETATAAKARLDDWCRRDIPIEEVYRWLQAQAGSRQVVDKSPAYGGSLNTLTRAEAIFDSAKYLHLVRHPYAMIESFVRMRMNRLLGTGATDPYDVAEEIWSSSNSNIRALLAGVDPARHRLVYYEDLVARPEQTMTDVCAFLELPYRRGAAAALRGGANDARRARELDADRRSQLCTHTTVDARLGDAWKHVQLGRPLGAEARRVASSLRYELPEAAAERAPATVAVSTGEYASAREMRVTIRGLKLCVTTWGPESGPTILLVHGILDHGAAWELVAAPLAARGYRVVAPDLRGHGRSAHVARGDAYYGLDFVADVDALVRAIIGRPFVLVGHSMGGAISVMYTTARPESVRALVLVEPLVPSAAPDQDPGRQLITHLDYIASDPKHSVFAGVEQAAAILRHQTPSIPADMAHRMARRLTEPCEGGVRWAWDPLLRTRTGIGFDSAFERASYFEMVAALAPPLTLVFGSQSGFNRPENERALQQTARSSATFELPGGHNLHADSPLALAEIIASAASVRLPGIGDGRVAVEPASVRFHEDQSGYTDDAPGVE